MTTNTQKVARISGEIKITAKISHDDLRELLWKVYRLKVIVNREDETEPIKELDSYLDSNFVITGKNCSSNIWLSLSI